MVRNSRLPGRPASLEPDHLSQPDPDFSSFANNPTFIQQPFLSQASYFSGNNDHSTSSALSPSSESPHGFPLSPTPTMSVVTQPGINPRPMTSSSSDRHVRMIPQFQQPPPPPLLSQFQLWSTQLPDQGFHSVQPYPSTGVVLTRNSTTRNVPPWRSRPRPPSGSSNPSAEVCRACFDSHDPLIRLGCRHAYCEPCLNSLIEVALKNRSTFPPRCCSTRSGLISVKKLRKHITPTNMTRYDNVSEEFANKDPTYCANKHCSIYFKKKHLHVCQTKFLICPACQFETCKECKQDRKIHASDTCPKPEELMNTQDQALAKEKKWKQCIKCKNLIERIEGCDHMTCPCGANFCYRCGGDMSEQTAHICKCVQEQFPQAFAMGYPPPIMGYPPPINPHAHALGHLGNRALQEYQAQVQQLNQRNQRLFQARQAARENQMRASHHLQLRNQSASRSSDAQFGVGTSRRDEIALGNQPGIYRPFDSTNLQDTPTMNQPFLYPSNLYDPISPGRIAGRQEPTCRVQNHGQQQPPGRGSQYISDPLSNLGNVRNQYLHASSIHNPPRNRHLVPNQNTAQIQLPQTLTLQQYLRTNRNNPTPLPELEDPYLDSSMFESFDSIGDLIHPLEHPLSLPNPNAATQSRPLVPQSTSNMVSLPAINTFGASGAASWTLPRLSTAQSTQAPSFDPDVDMFDWDYNFELNQDL